jgi:hypothetical protein
VRGTRVAVPLLTAAVLGGLAVATVEKAGCADPGHYERVATGYELVGGCFDRADLMVPEAPAPDRTDPAAPSVAVPTRS